MTEEKNYPPLWKQGKNLAEFSFELIKHAIHTGALRVSDEVQNKRMEICRNCEKYDEDQIRCTECGCFLVHKVSLSIDSCPLKKWEAFDKDWIEAGFNNVVEDMEKK